MAASGDRGELALELVKDTVLVSPFQAGWPVVLLPPFLPSSPLFSSWDRKKVWEVGEETQSVGVKRWGPVKILYTCH